MRVKMILPALTEAKSPLFRPIKYSLFPPLGLATLAGYLDDGDEVTIQDEHVETLVLSDRPNLVVIQVYITSAYRAYALADHYRARGAHVCLGGLHVTSLPEEAAQHADTIFLGPGEDTWPQFLADYRAGRPAPLYRILTPYPGTALHTRMQAEGRIAHANWDLYDTRHVVYRPARLAPDELERGYWKAYRDFYRWGAIARGAWTKELWGDRLRHLAYAGGWKKLEPLWDAAIRVRRVTSMLPVLEGVLSGFGRYTSRQRTIAGPPALPALPQADPELELLSHTSSRPQP